MLVVMKLINCPSCNERISPYADPCPQCGCPERKFETVRDSIRPTDRLARRDVLPWLYTREEIAKFIGVSDRTISNMTKSRRIPYMKIGRTIRFNPKRVMEALDLYEVMEVGWRK
jgi:excisionase family DNA binding protein